MNENIQLVTIPLVQYNADSTIVKIKSKIFPYYCDCSTFIDLAYCHHLLAINRLGLSKISIDPLFIAPEPPRRLVTRNNRRNAGHGKKIKGFKIGLLIIQPHFPSIIVE